MPARLTAFSRSMTGAALRTTVAGFGQFAVGTDTGLAVEAPEQSIIAARHSRIGFRGNELALPSQRRAEVRMIDVETIRFAGHAAPPDAAFKMARFTATRASCTL